VSVVVSRRPGGDDPRVTSPGPALSGRALRAAVEVAEAHGLRFSRPVVLRDLSNLLVHLRPAPVVARVSTATGTMRPGEAWLAREVAVAGHLAAAGAPVVAPSAELPPGPHRHDGLALSFWTFAEETPGALDAEAAGRALRVCHEALADFPGPLPEHAVFREARRVLAGLGTRGALAVPDAQLLERAAERLEDRLAALALPLQAVHGDAHLGNVIQTPAGPLWNDWEDTFRGPVAWDLGCLHASARVFGGDPAAVAAAQRGYGAAPAPEVLDLLVEARAFQGTVWTVLISGDRPGGPERVAARLAWFRARERRSAGQDG
jgi:aminoglycoside phosphotransferase (APT) family kinase protein